ncbi:MAG: hypothetical protein OSA45_14245 [Halioglobus sp.]|nr:hypothetical protein [Halioglobus sp.]
MDFLSDWQQPLLWVSGLSLLGAAATIVAVPWVITRLPKDYFAQEERIVWRESSREPVFAFIGGLLKNLFGLLLIILGLIMLVTPGQGILTLLIGLMLMNFPGKYHVERWLVMRPGVMRGMNWLRTRRGQTPFDMPQDYSIVD